MKTIKTNDIKEVFITLNPTVLEEKGFVDNGSWQVEELKIIRETEKAYGIEDLEYVDKVAFWLPKSLIYVKK